MTADSEPEADKPVMNVAGKTRTACRGWAKVPDRWTWGAAIKS